MIFANELPLPETHVDKWPWNEQKMTDKNETRNPYESVVVHWRYKPTGDEGEMATILGRQAAEDYIAEVSQDSPGNKFDWWIVTL